MGRVKTGNIHESKRLLERSASGHERRGRYVTLTEAAELYPVFGLRLLRRLVQERRIAFSRVGRLIVLAEGDIEEYFEHNRVEPVQQPGPPSQP